MRLSFVLSFAAALDGPEHLHASVSFPHLAATRQPSLLTRTHHLVCQAFCSRTLSGSLRNRVMLERIGLAQEALTP